MKRILASAMLAVVLPASGAAIAQSSDGERTSSAASIQLTSAMIRQIERRLESIGYEVGSVDGRWDGQLETGIRSFQQDLDLEPSGGPTYETVTALGLFPAFAETGVTDIGALSIAPDGTDRPADAGDSGRQVHGSAEEFRTGADAGSGPAAYDLGRGMLGATDRRNQTGSVSGFGDPGDLGTATEQYGARLQSGDFGGRGYVDYRDYYEDDATWFR